MASKAKGKVMLMNPHLGFVLVLMRFALAGSASGMWCSQVVFFVQGRFALHLACPLRVGILKKKLPGICSTLQGLQETLGTASAAEPDA